MKYADGKSIQVGDIAVLDNGNDRCIIKDVIQNEGARLFYGVDSYGIFVESYKYGLLFLSEESLRAENAKLIMRNHIR